MKFLLVLSLLAVTVSADEEWLSPSSCPCGRVYIPVCGSNGITYNNMCEFLCACEHLIFLLCLYLSTCLGQWSGFAEKDCVCTSQYDPVCGSDRRRYYNVCTYRCRLEYLRTRGLPMIDTIDCRTLPPPAPIH